MFVAINGSAVELADLEAYAEQVVGARALVAWNMELDTLRADLGEHDVVEPACMLRGRQGARGSVEVAGVQRGAALEAAWASYRPGPAPTRA